MGRKLHYRPGSFYRTSDRTGFPQRAEDTRMEWTGLIVEKARWEPRQPQDLVKGVPDQQWVPDARPLGQNIYVGPISVQTTADAIVGQTQIMVESTFGFYVGARVGCMLDYDNGTVFWTTVEGFTTIAGIPGDLTSESGVDLVSDSGQWIGQNLISEAGTYIVLAKGIPSVMSSGNLITLYKPSPSVMAVPPS